LFVATAAPAEKRERPAVPSSSLRLLAPIRPESTRLLHLTAALLSDMFVARESATPHTEPAVDGRCLVATASAVFVRGPVDLKHGFYSEIKSSRVGMIVKGYGYRSEGSSDGSFPETL